MKNVKKWILSIGAVIAVFSLSIFIDSCSKKSDEAPALTLVSITANDVDLNGATSPSNVVTNAVITATFSTDVKEGSISSATVTLLEDYDTKTLSATYAVSGKVVTITPAATFGNGTLIKV